MQRVPLVLDAMGVQLEPEVRNYSPISFSSP